MKLSVIEAMLLVVAANPLAAPDERGHRSLAPLPDYSEYLENPEATVVSENESVKCVALKTTHGCLKLSGRALGKVSPGQRVTIRHRPFTVTRVSLNSLMVMLEAQHG